MKRLLGITLLAGGVLVLSMVPFPRPFSGLSAFKTRWNTSLDREEDNAYVVVTRTLDGRYVVAVAAVVIVVGFGLLISSSGGRQQQLGP